MIRNYRVLIPMMAIFLIVCAACSPNEGAQQQGASLPRSCQAHVEQTEYDDGREQIYIVLDGEGGNGAVANLYRFGSDAPLRPSQMAKTYIDTGRPYVHQFYTSGFAARAAYRLEYGLRGGDMNEIEIRIEPNHEVRVDIVCS